MPTPGSSAGSKSYWPTPRIEAASDGPKAAPAGFRVTFGAWLATCSIEVWPRFSSIWAFTAVMAIGVCWTFCDRNWAVTTTSPMVLDVWAAGAC